MTGSGGRDRTPIIRELSAGGLVCRRRRNGWQVCLGARRRGRDGTLAWGIPKGQVEPGEPVAAAAVREVREETGLESTVEDVLGDLTYWYVRRDASGAPVRVRKRVRVFLLAHRGGRFADRDRELDAVRWFSLDEAEAHVAYPNEREMVRRARERLIGGSPPGGAASGRE